MKKILFLLLITSISIGSSIAQKPEKIYSFVKIDKPHEYYTQQVELWWKEIEKDQKNEDAWYNYYKANRNSYYTFKEVGFNLDKEQEWKQENTCHKNQDEIRELIKKNIPETFAYYSTLKKVAYDNDAYANMEKAYLLQPDASELYPWLIAYYESKGNHDKRKEFNQKMFEANELSSGFINYGYNVLMTLKTNSIIITNGDNDTYPLWLLQDVFNIRNDVVVLCLGMLIDPEYRIMMFNKIGLSKDETELRNDTIFQSYNHVANYILNNLNHHEYSLYVGMGAKGIVNGFDDNLYLVGLAFQYSTKNIENVAILRNNFENKYALDYITNRFEFDISASLVNKYNTHYFPGILKLYNYYKSAGDMNSSNKMKNLGMEIAQKHSQGWYDYAKSVLK